MIIGNRDIHRLHLQIPQLMKAECNKDFRIDLIPGSLQTVNIAES